MATGESRPRFNEQVVGAGTTARFVMLLVLLLAASGSMVLPIMVGLHASGRADCELAAGVDPYHSGSAPSLVSATGQAVAFTACIAKYAPVPPWWTLAGVPLLLSVALGVLFCGLPAWKARRGRVVPLESVDRDGEIRRLLAALSVTTGLARLPRVVVDPTAGSTSAVVFGSNRRPTVCLHGGLLARRRSDPEGFRAVLLHELAHVANGDVTVTYLTVALWRVFLGLVLLPYLVWLGRLVHDSIGSWTWSSEAPLARAIALPVVTVILVHLARSDVLRSREVFADLVALRWGADPQAWAFTTPAQAGGALRRALASFRELWSTHPRWELRRSALTDPGRLFGVRALPMFLVGATAALIDYHLLEYLAPYNLFSEWLGQVVALAPAALVTAAVGIAWWRAVAQALLVGSPVPSGVRAGLWLGAGISVGGMLTGYGSGSDWLPSRPQFLLLPVLVAVAYACWVAQCARLWAGTWRGRSLRPAMLLSLVAACLVLSSWFSWWEGFGALFSNGLSFDSAGVREVLTRAFPGQSASLSAVPSAVLAVLPVLLGVIYTPLVLLAVTALWVVPLATWSTGFPAGRPRWVRGTLEGTASGGDPETPVGERMPPLRRVLLPGLLGGTLGTIAVAVVQACLHTAQPGPQQRGGVHVLVYTAWICVALVAASALAAVAAGLVLDRCRLLGALIAAETAALLGLAGMFALVSADGCLGPLNTLEGSCAWRARPGR